MMIKKVVGGGISRLNYLSDDTKMFKGLQEFDQQDWELKLGEHGCENEFHTDSILSICKDVLKRLVDENDSSKTKKIMDGCKSNKYLFTLGQDIRLVN